MDCYASTFPRTLTCVGTPKKISRPLRWLSTAVRENHWVGGKQLGFGDYEQTTARKRTKRERFLAQIEVGAFYWTVPVPDIVNSGREEQGSVSV